MFSSLTLILIIEPNLTCLLLIRIQTRIRALGTFFLLDVIFLNLGMNFLLDLFSEFNRVLQINSKLIFLISISFSFGCLIWRWLIALDHWFGVTGDASSILLFLLVFLFILLVCLADWAPPRGLGRLLWPIVEFLSHLSHLKSHFFSNPDLDLLLNKSLNPLQNQMEPFLNPLVHRLIYILLILFPLARSPTTLPLLILSAACPPFTRSSTSGGPWNFGGSWTIRSLVCHIRWLVFLVVHWMVIIAVLVVIVIEWLLWWRLSKQ